MENTETKPQFELLESLEPIVDGKNTFYLSTQKITQPNQSSSEHLVIKKQPTNEDGSPQGNAKQLFIPIKSSEKILTSALELLKHE